MAASAIGAAIGGGLGLIGANKKAKAQKEAARIGADAADPFRAHRGRYADMLNQFMTTGPQWPSGALGYGQGNSTVPYLQGTPGISSTGPLSGGAGSTGPQQQQTSSQLVTDPRVPFGIAPPTEDMTYNRQKFYTQILMNEYNQPVDDYTMPVPQIMQRWNEKYGTTSSSGQQDSGQSGAGGGSGNQNQTYLGLDPSYAFRFNEGLRALNRGFAAGGNRMSGNRLFGLMEYGQNLASTEYANAFNRLAMLSGASSGSPAGAGQVLAQGYGNAAGSKAQGLNALGHAAGGVVDAIGSYYNTPSYNPTSTMNFGMDAALGIPFGAGAGLNF